MKPDTTFLEELFFFLGVISAAAEAMLNAVGWPRVNTPPHIVSVGAEARSILVMLLSLFCVFCNVLPAPFSIPGLFHLHDMVGNDANFST